MTIKEVKDKAIVMAEKLCMILDLISEGFMDNKMEPLNKAISEERAVNELERSLIKEIFEISKTEKSASGKKELSAMGQVIETLEHMGDETAGIIERIEIKIAEHLLFSETGVEQFNETYNVMKDSVKMMHKFLSKPDSVLKDRIVDNGFKVKGLVERYRKEHFDRMVQGLCTPMGANMYFDMLDLTGSLARHSSNIVKIF